MIRHKVHDDVHASLMHFLDELVEIGHAAVERIDVVVGYDIVAVVFSSRQINRIEPDDFDTQMRQVV